MTTTSKTKQKTNHKSTSRAIAWEGLERPPAKRWWWYLGFGYVSFLGIALLISLDQWAFAITMTAAAGAAFVVYIGKPRGVKARLTSTSLIVNGQEFPLANYRSFRIDNDDAVVLVPRRLVRLRVLVSLPGNEAADQRIIDALAKKLPLQDSSPDVLERLARWVRLG